MEGGRDTVSAQQREKQVASRWQPLLAEPAVPADLALESWAPGGVAHKHFDWNLGEETQGLKLPTLGHHYQLWKLG